MQVSRNVILSLLLLMSISPFTCFAQEDNPIVNYRAIQIPYKQGFVIASIGEDIQDEQYKEEDEEEWMEDPFAHEEMSQGPLISDPIEPVNRVIFQFNDKMYCYVMRPVAKVYRFILPERIRIGITQFFANLDTPIRFANCMFQGKFKEAGVELSRFFINTALGVGGFFDPAKDYMGLKKHKEDFGQTLGYYGKGHGFYIVLPLLGPSSFRDSVGYVTDLAFDPLTYMLDWKPWFVVRTTEEVNWTSLHIGEYEDIKRQALDPYLFIRNAYAQHRAAMVRR